MFLFHGCMKPSWVQQINSCWSFEVDKSGDGYLSRDELKDALKDKRVKTWLSAMEIEVDAYMYIHMYIYIYICICLSLSIYVDVYACLYIYIHSYVFLYIYIYYTYLCICIYIHIIIYIYTWNGSTSPGVHFAWGTQQKKRTTQ